MASDVTTITDKQRANISAFVAGLRNGTYNQGFGQCYSDFDGVRLCAWGVALELASGRPLNEKNVSTIAEETLREELYPDHFWARCVYLNDNAGLSFPEIADKIEQEYLVD